MGSANFSWSNYSTGAGFYQTLFAVSSLGCIFKPGEARSGLIYGEINKIPPFDRLKQDSLGKLYLDAKARLQRMIKKSKNVKHRSRFPNLREFQKSL